MKSAAKATTGAVKTAFTAAKALVAAIMAGGWGAVAVIVMICMIVLICGSVFGVFFSGEDSGTGMSMQTAVQEINAEYDAKVEDEKSAASYDNVEISGGRAVWKEVLAQRLKLKRLTERFPASLGVSISNNIDKKTGKLLPAFLFACVIKYSCCGFVCCCI